MAAYLTAIIAGYCTVLAEFADPKCCTEQSNKCIFLFWTVRRHPGCGCAFGRLYFRVLYQTLLNVLAGHKG